jgi:glutathione synthase/RimK-type ligase-like ATP-grasp enzyme
VERWRKGEFGLRKYHQVPVQNRLLVSSRQPSNNPAMSELNTDRALNRMIREIALEQGVAVESFGHGWIFRLTRADTVRFLYGYGFDLNSAATHAIACDKAATSEVLAARGIPRVEHRLYLHPRMAQFVPHRGNWRDMLAFAARHNGDVVVKENSGTGGRGVYRVRGEVELEHAVYRLFDQTHALAISPFYEARDEVRFVILGGRCEVAYAKVRPTVTGDGRRSVLEILAQRISDEGGNGPTTRLVSNIDPDVAAALGEVLPEGVTRLLNWRHNLGQGASIQIVDPNAPAYAPLLALAHDAARAMNLVIGSVDVITTASGAMVMEVNAGLMMEFLASNLPGGYDLAKGIYGRAMRLMFDVPIAGVRGE